MTVIEDLAYGTGYIADRLTLVTYRNSTALFTPRKPNLFLSFTTTATQKHIVPCIGTLFKVYMQKTFHSSK